MRVHTQGLHREALSQLVHARRDLPAARSYCRAYARSPREWQQHLLTLLDVLWAPAARGAEQGGAEILVLLRVDATLDSDRLRIDVSGGGDGLASVLTSALIDAFASELEGVGESTTGIGSILEPIVPLTDGRRVVIEDFEIVPGELAVQFRTERP